MSALPREFMSESPYPGFRFAPLPPLPRPVFFVTRDPHWKWLMDEGCDVRSLSQHTIDSIYGQCASTEDIFTVQMYLDFKQCGLDVRLCDQPVPDQICVVPYWYLRGQFGSSRSYIVAVQHDAPRPALCEQRVTINDSQANGIDAHFVPVRPQPCLRPRDPQRGATIRTIAFKGEVQNLHETFRTPAFLAGLDQMGVELRVSTQLGDREQVFRQWADYSDVDLVLAVRDNTVFDINLKPALKLINAWMAGAPALLSPEPAYRQLRRSALDYIEITRPEHALAAIRHLQRHPSVYRSMIDNGFERARDFQPDQYVRHWAALFSGPIEEGYRRWTSTPALLRHSWWPVRHLLRRVRHRGYRQIYQHAILSGKRILSDSEPGFALELVQAAA
jgi:hypothetical protein